MCCSPGSLPCASACWWREPSQPGPAWPAHVRLRIVGLGPHVARRRLDRRRERQRDHHGAQSGRVRGRCVPLRRTMVAWEGLSPRSMARRGVRRSVRPLGAHRFGPRRPLDPLVLHPGPGWDVGQGGDPDRSRRPLRHRRVAADPPLPLEPPHHVLLVWSGPGPGCDGPRGRCLAGRPGWCPGMGKSAHPVPRQRLPARRGLDDRSGGGGVDPIPPLDRRGPSHVSALGEEPATVAFGMVATGPAGRFRW